jgi:AcrR family transcriptional regulator
VRSSTGKKREHYHHGHLRDALIEAGLAIVEEDGIDAVSLRAVARRAKVSHSAPYHHFASKAELLAALAAAGFDRLVADIQAKTAEGQAGQPIDQLRAIGRAYMHFGASNPSVFRLMFRPELTKPSEHGLLQAAEARAFGTLIETIIRCQTVGQLPASDPLKLAAFAWSGVHGMATLRVEQLLNETPLGNYVWEELVENVNDFIITGMTRANESPSRAIATGPAPVV